MFIVIILIIVVTVMYIYIYKIHLYIIYIYINYSKAGHNYKSNKMRGLLFQTALVCLTTCAMLVISGQPTGRCRSPENDHISHQNGKRKIIDSSWCRLVGDM